MKDMTGSGWECQSTDDRDVKEAADGICKETRTTETGKALIFIRENGYAFDEYMEKLKKRQRRLLELR